MKAVRHWRGLASVGLAAGLVLAAPACSLLYDLEADQCAVDDDCARFGGDLSVCDAGVCVSRVDPAGGSSSGGSGNMGGEAGAPLAPECISHASCIDENFGEPFLCLQGQCVDLVTEECPLVVGAQNLRAEEPIVFGAYAVAPDGVSRSLVTRNLELAISEFTSKVTGLRGGPNGSRRTLAFVVCNSTFADVAPGTIDPFQPSLTHLVDTLRVPGIVAALSAKDLQAVFSQKLNAAGTFVISPHEQDSELAALNDDGRLWHMLGATSDLAPTFGALLKRTETYLRRDESFLNLPQPGAALRVALVTANIARESDVRDALLELPVLDDFDVEPLQIESASVTSTPDVASVAEAVLDYQPHIIVALAGSEFIEGVFPLLEASSTWSSRTSGQQRPMYLLGSTMATQTWNEHRDKQGQDTGGWKTLFDRIVGVAYASAEDPALLKLYQARLIGANADVDPSLLVGSESAYDAAYLMIYAAAAAGEVPSLDGKDMATGMRRLIDGAAYDIGPTSISKVLTALDNDEDIELRLTMGEPNWNAARGTRAAVGSVYCLNDGKASTEDPDSLGPLADALRYDPASDTLEDEPLVCVPSF